MKFAPDEATPGMLNDTDGVEVLKVINNWIVEMQVVRSRALDTSDGPPLAQAYRAMVSRLPRAKIACYRITYENGQVTQWFNGEPEAWVSGNGLWKIECAYVAEET